MAMATACSGMTHVFFPPTGTVTDKESAQEKAARERAAKSICADCDVSLLCLERSMVLDEAEGVWGGMGETERRHFRLFLRGVMKYDGIPEGDELYDAVDAFYRSRERAERRARAS